jgi:hypothetical protein
MCLGADLFIRWTDGKGPEMRPILPSVLHAWRSTKKEEKEDVGWASQSEREKHGEGDVDEVVQLLETI